MDGSGYQTLQFYSVGYELVFCDVLVILIARASSGGYGQQKTFSMLVPPVLLMCMNTNLYLWSIIKWEVVGHLAIYSDSFLNSILDLYSVEIQVAAEKSGGFRTTVAAFAK